MFYSAKRVRSTGNKHVAAFLPSFLKSRPKAKIYLNTYLRFLTDFQDAQTTASDILKTMIVAS